MELCHYGLMATEDGEVVFAVDLYRSAVDGRVRAEAVIRQDGKEIAGCAMHVDMLRAWANYMTEVADKLEDGVVWQPGEKEALEKAPTAKPLTENGEEEVPVKKPKAKQKSAATFRVSAGPTMAEAVARELNRILARTAYDYNSIQGWPGTHHMALTLLDTAARAVADGLTRSGIKNRMRTALKRILEREAPDYDESASWPGEHVLVNGVIDLILNKEK